jgi:hypothetical protein
LIFESANVSGYLPGSDIPVADGYPDWTVSYSALGAGTNIATTVIYDEISLGGAFVSINDSNTGFGFNPIQGNFSACLFGGPSDIFSPSNPTYSTISQTGLVPNGTKTLLMDVNGGSFMVTLGGQTIILIPLQTFLTYNLYGGNITGYAGQVAQLTITAPPTGVPNMELIDNIQFSTMAIPEPNTLALGALGGLFFGFRSLPKISRMVFTKSGRSSYHLMNQVEPG